jgi:hypothetical protein
MDSGFGTMAGLGLASGFGIWALGNAFWLDAGAIPVNFSCSLRFFLAPLDKF